MKGYIFRKIVILIFLVSFLNPLAAEDKRTLPLDMYLIIDDSASLLDSKNDTVAWINEQIVDRILADGDMVTIWAAGDGAQVIYSGTISGSAGIKGIKDALAGLKTEGKSADFSGALSDAVSRAGRTSQDRNRLSYIMLVAGSARGLEPVLTGNSQSLLRWFRSEKYERWQVLVVAPDIGSRVREAAAAYMSAVR